MMNKYEFYLRFAMVKGPKLHYLKHLSPITGDTIDEKAIFNQWQLSPLQQAAFYQVDKASLRKILIWLSASQHYLITYNDRDYPPQLKQISSAPPVLFVMGNKTLLSSPQIAMVGSRHCSEYGARWCRYFANQLARHNITITSGLALGIDAISHLGALDVNGNTLAVLGSGLTHITPQTNYSLAQQILTANGALVSEFLPDQPARPEYFPRRNRIISGLSLATFVVEASPKSGSLITAKYALEQNRDVFALPGTLDNEQFAGTHWLIKQGAYLVTEPQDILEQLNHHFNWLNFNTTARSSTMPDNPYLDEEQENISEQHQLILQQIKLEPRAIDLIAQEIDLSISELNSQLIELELAGKIKLVTGGYIKAG